MKFGGVEIWSEVLERSLEEGSFGVKFGGVKFGRVKFWSFVRKCSETG